MFKLSGSSTGHQQFVKKRKDEEVKWSATATMAERIREQTNLTLTERLRREFGLDTVDESEDNQGTVKLLILATLLNWII